MKTDLLRMAVLSGALALPMAARAQTAPEQPASAPAAAVAVESNAPAASPAESVAVAAAPGETNAPAALAVGDTNAPAAAVTNSFLPPATGPGGERELRLNFRGAPIEMVLNYLSDAAGFIIELHVPLKGKVDVWSNQPVTRDEAVDLLNSVLNQNGYAAVRNGRTLTIMSKEDALHGDIPVKISTDPSSLAKTDEIITAIIPIRFVEAAQLVKDLSPMTPPRATIIANEAGNSIVITDTQANIRHVAEIIKAIDLSAEDATEVRVFRLKHHDPVEIANLLSGLFANQGTSGAQSPIRLGGVPGGFGGGPFGRFMAAGGAGAPAGGANARTDRIKKREQVVAVPDVRTSSVVVTASKDLMAQIAGMLEQLDQVSPKVAHVSVIHLENADPQQVRQVLQDMFQSSNTSRNTATQTSPLMNRIQQNTGTATLGGSMGTTGLGGSRSGSGVPSF